MYFFLNIRLLQFFKCVGCMSFLFIHDALVAHSDVMFPIRYDTYKYVGGHHGNL